MQLALATAEALSGPPAIEAGLADWLSCTDGLRLIASTVLALLLLAAWRPVRWYFSSKSTADARLVQAWHVAAIVAFLGDAYFAFWNLRDCLANGISDTGNPDWFPVLVGGVMVAAMWKSGVFDGKESKEGEVEDEE